MAPNPSTQGYVFFHFPGESKLISLISQLRATEEEIPICIEAQRRSCSACC